MAMGLETMTCLPRSAAAMACCGVELVGRGNPDGLDVRLLAQLLDRRVRFDAVALVETPQRLGT